MRNHQGDSIYCQTFDNAVKKTMARLCNTILEEGLEGVWTVCTVTCGLFAHLTSIITVILFSDEARNMTQVCIT